MTKLVTWEDVASLLGVDEVADTNMFEITATWDDVGKGTILTPIGFGMHTIPCIFNEEQPTIAIIGPMKDGTISVLSKVDVHFNEDVHQCLTELGFTHTHHMEDFEDDGDGESGPHLTGGPAFDEYEDASERIIVDHHGMVVSREDRDLAFEAYCARMGGE